MTDVKFSFAQYNYLFYCVNRNLRETTKWCVFQEKTWTNKDIFSMHHGIVDDFVLHCYYELQSLRMNKKSKEFDKHSLHILFICKVFARRSYFL